MRPTLNVYSRINHKLIKNCKQHKLVRNKKTLSLDNLSCKLVKT